MGSTSSSRLVLCVLGFAAANPACVTTYYRTGADCMRSVEEVGWTTRARLPYSSEEAITLLAGDLDVSWDEVALGDGPLGGRLEDRFGLEARRGDTTPTLNRRARGAEGCPERWINGVYGGAVRWSGRSEAPLDFGAFEVSPTGVAGVVAKANFELLDAAEHEDITARLRAVGDDRQPTALHLEVVHFTPAAGIAEVFVVLDDGEEVGLQRGVWAR